MKIFFKFALFSLTLLTLILFSRSSVFAEYPLICGKCPGGGLPYFNFSSDGITCNSSYPIIGTFCASSGNTCITPKAEFPNCTGIEVTLQSISDIYEGNPYVYTNSGSFTDQFSPSSYTATVDYGDGTGVQNLTLNDKSFSLSHSYANIGTFTVIVTVKPNTGLEGVATSQFKIINVSPTVGSISVDKNGVYPNEVINATATFSDPGSTTDSYTAVWEWGDGNTTTGAITGSSAVSGSHAYTTPGYYTIKLTVTDKDGGSDTATYYPVQIKNPPDITGGINLPSIINKEVTLSGYFWDHGDFEEHTITWDWGDGSSSIGEITLVEPPFTTITNTHSYASYGTYHVTLTVRNNYGGLKVFPIDINVVPPPPVIGIFVVSPTAAVNTLITPYATFTDSAYEFHTAVWDWGDGTTSPGTVRETIGSGGNVTDSHTYISAGVYKITLTVKSSNGIGESYQYVSVYDPANGGFLTGSGKFISPLGALTQNPSLSGNLKFGVEAKYTKYSIFPKGKIKFEFKKEKVHSRDGFNREDDDFEFEFESTSYQWLVISENVAYLQGTGTINGKGNYNVLLTVVDGSQTNTSDLVRIQVTDPLTNSVVYDNEFGSPTYALPTTSIGKGSVKIHSAH